MRTSVEGNGTPTVPGRRVGATGLPTVIGDVSVIPYPSTSRPPVTCSHSSTVAGGSDIAPEIAYRMEVRSTARSRAAVASFA